MGGMMASGGVDACPTPRCRDGNGPCALGIVETVEGGLVPGDSVKMGLFESPACNRLDESAGHLHNPGGEAVDEGFFPLGHVGRGFRLISELIVHLIQPGQHQIGKLVVERQGMRISDAGDRGDPSDSSTSGPVGGRCGGLEFQRRYLWPR
jgi:hypothetical protein